MHAEVHGGDAGVEQHAEIGGREAQFDGAILAHAVRNQPVGGGGAPIVEEAPDSVGRFAHAVAFGLAQPAMHRRAARDSASRKKRRDRPTGPARGAAAAAPSGRTSQMASASEAGDPRSPFQVHIDRGLGPRRGLRLGGGLPFQQLLPGDETRSIERVMASMESQRLVQQEDQAEQRDAWPLREGAAGIANPRGKARQPLRHAQQRKQQITVEPGATSTSDGHGVQ